MNDKDKEIWEKHPKISHYTSVDVALRIMESQKLRATKFNSEKIEDEKEIILAQDKYLIPAFKEEFPKKQIKDIKHDIKNILYGALNNQIYLTCFSKMPDKCQIIKDNDGLLSMWRYYAKDNGCYIEFDTKLLYEYEEKEKDEDEKKEKPRAKIMDEVVYKHPQGRFKKDAEYVAKVYKKIKGLKSKEEQNKLIDRIFIEKFLNLIILCKHPAFQDEREIRIGLCPITPIPDNSIKKEFITYPFKEEAITKIVVGPSEQAIDNMVKLKSYINGSKEYSHVEICKSDIPIKMHKK